MAARAYTGQVQVGEDVVMQSITSVSVGSVDLWAMAVVDLLASHVTKLRRHARRSCIESLPWYHTGYRQPTLLLPTIVPRRA
jgi:hypothetical protein